MAHYGLTQCAVVYSTIISLFPRLQVEHSVCRLLRVVLPPLDHGVMWSICKVTDGSLFGDAPQKRQVNLSRTKTSKRSLGEGTLLFWVFSFVAVGGSSVFVMPKILRTPFSQVPTTNSL